jgi:TolA-binding protein
MKRRVLSDDDGNFRKIPRPIARCRFPIPGTPRERMTPLRAIVTTIDQHPEDLLDRALRTNASPGEMRELREHVRRCEACVAHLTLGKELALALVPRAEDRMRNERAVVLTVSKLARKQRHRHVRQIWLLVAAVVCIAGAAGAQLWTLQSPIDAPAVVLAVAAPSRALPRQIVAVPMVSPRALALVAEAPDNTRKVETPGDKQRVRREPAAEQSETAATLFSQANELRRAGRDDQAIQAYQKLQRLFPETPQAEQSHASLGQLLLQHLSADEALTQFDRYLAHEGPLTEDVLVGRALALQRLGRVHEERKTWESLLHHFPSSVHATRAKARLAALSAAGREVR